jgi:predicted nucleic acid-binding protein
VKYWDASALAPLILDEPASDLVRGWLREDSGVVTWGLTRLELASAIERRAREGVLSSSARVVALRRLERLAADSHEVSDLSAVRVRALPLLARHPLRAADAAQLGAALLVAEADPGTLTMAVLDRRLGEAASREGLRVLTWPE